MTDGLLDVVEARRHLSERHYRTVLSNIVFAFFESPLVHCYSSVDQDFDHRSKLAALYLRR